MSLSLFFVDCEATGPCPEFIKPDGTKSVLTEFGCVHYPTKRTFHGVLFEAEPDPANPTMSRRTGGVRVPSKEVFVYFDDWIQSIAKKDTPRAVSDNPAFDWQWINHGFWNAIGSNPFGHTARRIGDYYAGLVRDFDASNKWKRLRITKHDHNPVNDAMGNVEAFERIIRGER